MPESEINWTHALRAADSGEQAAAVSALRKVLLTGLRAALSSRRDVSEDQLEDFTQESLLRVLDRLDQFQGRSRFTTWAHSIALNTAFTELRRKRWQDVSLDEMMAKGERMAEPEAMPENQLGEDEDSTRLVGALRRAIAEELTPKQRAAIHAELTEMPFDQVAALLGTNRNAAYKLVHDARKALRRRLNEAGITAEDIRTAFNP